MCCTRPGPESPAPPLPVKKCSAPRPGPESPEPPIQPICLDTEACPPRRLIIPLPGGPAPRTPAASLREPWRGAAAPPQDEEARPCSPSPAAPPPTTSRSGQPIIRDVLRARLGVGVRACLPRRVSGHETSVFGPDPRLGRGAHHQNGGGVRVVRGTRGPAQGPVPEQVGRLQGPGPVPSPGTRRDHPAGLERGVRHAAGDFVGEPDGAGAVRHVSRLRRDAGGTGGPRRGGTG